MQDFEKTNIIDRFAPRLVDWWYSFVDEVKPEQRIGTAAVSGNYCWLLNAGHGRLQPGKRSPLLPPEDSDVMNAFIRENGEPRFYEWQWNRMVVEAASVLLGSHGIDHRIVVPEDDVGKFLRGRVARGNNMKAHRPKRWVGIHANAMTNDIDEWGRAEGTECWYYTGSVLGRQMAEVFQRNILAPWPVRIDRGVKSNRKFTELKYTRFPATILEYDFYDDRDGVYRLMDNVDTAAKALVNGILELEQL